MIGYKAMRDELVKQGALAVSPRFIVNNSHRFPEYDVGPYLYVDRCDDSGNGMQIPLSTEECLVLREWLDEQINTAWRKI